MKHAAFAIAASALVAMVFVAAGHGSILVAALSATAIGMLTSRGRRAGLIAAAACGIAMAVLPFTLPLAPGGARAGRVAAPHGGIVWPRLSEENFWDEPVSREAFPILDRSSAQWLGAPAFARLPGTDLLGLVDVRRAIAQARRTKDEDELAALRLAARATEEAIAEAVPLFVAGASERAIATALRDGGARRGCAPESFPTTVRGSGWIRRLPRHTRNTAALREGDVAFVELGCRVRGYVSEVNRMIPVGSIGPQQRARLDTLAAARAFALSACRDGATPASLSRGASVEVHGIGLAAHEPASIPLRAGEVVTLEPFLEGLRVSDAVRVRATDCELLCSPPG